MLSFENKTNHAGNEETSEPGVVLPVKTKKTADLLTYGESGADDEARTRYLHLGKVALYQMSYIRIYGNMGHYSG